jgi:putative addiction module component (TIGR02574 family)
VACSRFRAEFILAGEVDEMAIGTDELVSRIKELSDEEKLRLVDAILTDLNARDSKIDRIWADEARKRWAAYKVRKIPTVSYEEVIAKHRR